MMDLEEQLSMAALAAASRVTANVLARARLHFLDCLGVAIAGADEPTVRAVARALRESGAEGSAVLVGTPHRFSPLNAALLNGLAGHYHDYDDDEPAIAVGHPTVPVFGALIGAATEDATLGQMLTAYVIGSQTIVRLGGLINPGHYDRGFHATSTLGVFGAAVASALFLKADVHELRAALGLAASLSSGIKGNFGSDGKPLQVGQSSANGLAAALYAKQGVRPAVGALFGPHGFCKVHEGRAPTNLVDSFASPWALEEPGFNIKVYPCCSSTHTAVDGLLKILRDSGWTSGEIDEIEVSVGPDVPGILIYDVPTTPMEAKFSMRYCIAAAAVNRELTLRQFEAAALQDEVVMQRLESVRVIVDRDLPRNPLGATHASRVNVRHRSGAVEQRLIEQPLGSSARPMDDVALQRKFLLCAGAALGPKRADAAFKGWLGATDDTPVAHLLGLATPL